MFELRTSPIGVRHDVKDIKGAFIDWRAQWRAIINQGLNVAETACRETYHKYTNKTSGRRIRSEHISQMLTIDRQEVKGTPRASQSYLFSAYLHGGSVRGGKYGGARWEKIAYAQEFGAIIRPKTSRVIAVPNRRIIRSAFAEPTRFKDARWIKRGDKLFLERTPGTPSRPKIVRKPPKPTTNKPRTARKARMPATKEHREVLFIGVPQVRLKPRAFFHDSMREAARIIEREFPNYLRATFGKVL